MDVQARESRQPEGRMLEKYNGHKLDWLRDSLWFIVMILVVFVLLRFVIGLSVIAGESMEPTLHDGDIVVYLRPVRTYQTGDIVSIKVPSGKYYVKRVAASGGSVVDIYDDSLFVDGKETTDPHAEGVTGKEEGAVVYPYAVREDSYFVLGDNREASVDSRFFGEVNRRQIKGRIFLAVSKAGMRRVGRQ